MHEVIDSVSAQYGIYPADFAYFTEDVGTVISTARGFMDDKVYPPIEKFTNSLTYLEEALALRFLEDALANNKPEWMQKVTGDAFDAFIIHV